MDLRSTKHFLKVTFLVIVAALIIGSFMDSSLMIYIMLGFFGIFTVVYLMFWRCPNCKKHLGKLVAYKCKHCGHNLDV